jgi:GTP cyclohydrolase IA
MAIKGLSRLFGRELLGLVGGSQTIPKQRGLCGGPSTQSWAYTQVMDETAAVVARAQPDPQEEDGHAQVYVSQADWNSDDYAAIRGAVAQIIGVIDDPSRGDLAETPDRVARMYLELTKREPFSLTCFKNTAGYDQMIVEDGIVFYSLCEHHLVPFFGTAKVGYVPKNDIVGLSKIARTVDHHARGLQTQERITNNIADLLMERLRPHGVGVQLSAEHLCMSMRGVRKPGARTVTTALRGVFKAGPTREEFLK